ncbi:MAG: isoprenylcysteine carboxylmethyltransferase family protein [Tannerellaceae bacterium]|nr:isoprenylcysteine carboxylmethyltransferase family protein [Tannerellaceae bacterium]
MIRATVAFILRFAGRNRSRGYKTLSLIAGAALFLGLLPALFIFAGSFAEGYIDISLGRMAEIPAGIAFIILGLYILLWATVSQWVAGKGTPAPNAPTQSLVIAGPYRYCRNPIELGAILYYFGLGMIISGITTGLISFLLGLAIGSAYHKCIEEKELEQRFGEAYKAYKRRTPFLFPRIPI